MQQKKPKNTFEEVSTEIQNLIKKQFFKEPGYINKDLVEKLLHLTKAGDNDQRAYALLHLGKYICEERVHNRSCLEGIEYFVILVKERNLSTEENNVLAAAIEKTALQSKEHTQAVEILKKGYFELRLVNCLAALSDALLTGRFSPIQKNEVEWTFLLYNFLLKSLSSKNPDFSFYLHHVLACASVYKANEVVIKLLSNLTISEKWNQHHLWILQSMMVKNAKTNADDMLEINEALQIIDPSHLQASSVTSLSKI